MRKITQQKTYYFLDKLKMQLAQISHHPLTIVEAPSGFGKTTAVREYLKENLPYGSYEYWYTCLGESASMAWMGICELFSNVNGKVADDLKNLKMPTMDTLFYMATYLRDFHCQTETYLIIDNFQLVNCDIPRELISVFSMHGNPNLHLIFITQQLEAKHQLTIHSNDIHTIDSSAFFFDREGSSRLFRMEGIRLTNDEVENVYMSTEGWVSAIRLQIINFKESGSFDHTADIEQLVETAIWNRLTSEEKDFLLSVSIVDSFTTRQAAIMMGKEMLPEKIEDLLKNNDFIRYIPDKHLYSMHSILQDYLRNRFYHDQPENYQNLIFRKAGHACATISEYCPAAKFFYKVGDFDAIMSLPFSREYLDNQKDKYQPEFIAALVNECPEDTLCKYPFNMLVFGYQALVCGQLEVYQKLCRLLHLTVQNGMGFNQEELRKINGEYKLLASMKDFNYLPKMHEGKMEAWRILGKPTDMIKASTPWVFATTSALNMFWRESGELENELRQMDEFSPSYYKLANGHGSGSHSLMRAEAMLMRGEDTYAEILCHKALYEARSYQQTSICLCAELVLTQIAILRGDVEGYYTAIKNIQGYAKENSNLYVLRMIDVCMSTISLVLGEKDNVAPWLCDMDNIKKALYDPVVLHAQILYLKLLLIKKRYNEFYGICQLILDKSKNPTGNIKYMMPQVYQLIFLAMAKRSNGDNLEAQKHLKEALVIALPDQIYLPFAQQEGMEDFLSETIIDFWGNKKTEHVSQDTHKNHAVPLVGAINGISTSGGNGFAALNALCKRQGMGVGIIKKAILQDKSPLTPREREIAQLARDRLSAREISDKLYISETTVRTILRSVYSKLDIHSKSELAAKEF
jgi:LuxR family maltose regulon positive regulatory protein